MNSAKGSARVYQNKAFITRVTRQLIAFKKSASGPECRKVGLALSALNKALVLLKHTQDLHEVFLSANLHEKYLDDLKVELIKNDMGKGTIKNYRTGLRFIREKIVLSEAFQKAQKLQPTKLAPLSIGDTLKLLNEHFEPQLSFNQFAIIAADITEINVGSIRNWAYNGGQPKSCFRPNFSKLEVRYQLKHGTLQSKCAIASAHTKKNKGIKAAQVSSIKLPTKIMEQLEEVAMFKVIGKEPNRNAAFNDDPDLPIEIKGRKKWSVDNQGNPVSATMFLHCVERYMTWLHVEKEFKLEELGMHLTCRLKLLKEYTETIGAGSGTKSFNFGGATLNNSCVDSYNVASSSALGLLRTVRGMAGATGFLSNYYKPNDVNVERWFKEQVMLSENLKIWVDSIKAENKAILKVKKDAADNENTVGGLSNIQPLLDMGPKKALAGWKDIMETLRTTAKLNVASHGQVTEKAISQMTTAVWMAMSLETPVRSKNWSLLQLAEQPNTSFETITCVDGRYIMNVPINSLKTRRATSSVRAIAHTYQPVTCEFISDFLDMRYKRLQLLGIEDHGHFMITPRKGISTYYIDSKGKEGNRIANMIKNHTGRTMQQLWPDAGIPNYACINFHSNRHAVHFFAEGLGANVMASSALLGDSPLVAVEHYRDSKTLDGNSASDLAAQIANY
jgi:hypothetical protein